MKKLSTVCVMLLVAATTLTAQTTTRLPHAVAIRASGIATFLDVSFQDFSNKILLGGGGSLSVSYELPISPVCVIAFGVGGNYETTKSLDRDYYYQGISLGSVYAQLYYGVRLRHFFCNLGLQCGYIPPVTARVPNVDGDMVTARMTSYHYRSINGWAMAQAGYTTGRFDIGLDFRIAMMSQFKEGYTYPLVDAYRPVRTRHLSVGITAGYRFELGRGKEHTGR